MSTRQIREREFTSEVADKIRSLGYRVTEQPTRIPNQGTLANFFTKKLLNGPPPFTIDMIVEKDGRFVIVETAASPVYYSGLTVAHRLKGYFDTNVVICVPDHILPEIRDGVKSDAKLNDIRLFPESELVDVLQEALNP